MGHPLKKEGESKYTWKDYMGWSDKERWEVINGEAYDMSPSPTAKHQTIIINFGGILRNKLIGSPCKVFIAPLDVYFDEYNFVQPDLFVVCDKNKIKDRIYGAPDLIIEVISLSTSLKDKRDKKLLYERFGVKEYILIYPDEEFAERYLLNEGKYRDSDVFGPQEVITLSSITVPEIPLWEVFEVTKKEL